MLMRFPYLSFRVLILAQCSILVKLDKSAGDYALRLHSLRSEQMIQGAGVLRYATTKVRSGQHIQSAKLDMKRISSSLNVFAGSIKDVESNSSQDQTVATSQWQSCEPCKQGHGRNQAISIPTSTAPSESGFHSQIHSQQHGAIDMGPQCSTT